jgi:hypothetical protein
MLFFTIGISAIDNRGVYFYLIRKDLLLTFELGMFSLLTIDFDLPRFTRIILLDYFNFVMFLI